MSSADASLELEDTTRRFYEAIAQGDANAVRGITSESFLGIGSAADEWWDNVDGLAQHILAQTTELGGPMRVLRASPRARTEGSVGWVADREAAFGLSDGSVIPFRFTGVFHRQQGGWILLQFHLSVAVANEHAVHSPEPD